MADDSASGAYNGNNGDDDNAKNYSLIVFRSTFAIVCFVFLYFLLLRLFFFVGAVYFRILSSSWFYRRHLIEQWLQVDEKSREKIPFEYFESVREIGRRAAKKWRILFIADCWWCLMQYRTKCQQSPVLYMC